MLQGGGALHHVFGSPRFSADLDFAQQPDLDEAALAAALSHAAAEASRTWGACTLEAAPSKGRLHRQKLRVALDAGTSYVLAIERYEIPVHEPETRPALGCSESVRVESPAEIIADKVVAAVDRLSARGMMKLRDVFDVAFLLDFGRPGRDLVLAKLADYGFPRDLAPLAGPAALLDEVAAERLRGSCGTSCRGRTWSSSIPAGRPQGSRSLPGAFAMRRLSDELWNLGQPVGYVSFLTALVHHGVIVEALTSVQVASLDRAGPGDVEATPVEHHLLPRDLWFGYRVESFEGESVPVATPEKALLDWCWLAEEQGLDPRLDEMEWSILDRRPARPTRGRNRHLLPAPLASRGRLAARPGPPARGGRSPACAKVEGSSTSDRPNRLPGSRECGAMG